MFDAYENASHAAKELAVEAAGKFVSKFGKDAYNSDGKGLLGSQLPSLEVFLCIFHLGVAQGMLIAASVEEKPHA